MSLSTGLAKNSSTMKAAGDHGDEGKNHRFDHADAVAGEPQHHYRIESGEDHAGKQRNVKEKLESDGGAQHLGQIAGGDRDFAQEPKGFGDGGVGRLRGTPARGRAR